MRQLGVAHAPRKPPVRVRGLVRVRAEGGRAFALSRLAALDGEGTSTATWAATARASLFRNDAGEPCPDLLRLLGEGHSRGCTGISPPPRPRRRSPRTLATGRAGGKSSLPATGAGFGRRGSMYTTSSFVPVDLWSPGPSPAGSPAPASRRASDATDASLADGTSVSDASVDAREEHERSIARVRRGSRGSRFFGEGNGKELSGPEPRSPSSPTRPPTRTCARARPNPRRALRERLGREAARREATERELSALRDEASRKQAPRVGAAAARGRRRRARSRTSFPPRASPEGRDHLSRAGLARAALAAEQAEASPAAGTTDASPRDESAPRSAQGEPSWRRRARRARRRARPSPRPPRSSPCPTRRCRRRPSR